MKLWIGGVWGTLLLVALAAQAQPPDTLWLRHYGQTDDPSSVATLCETPDGGFVMGGDLRRPGCSGPCVAFLRKVSARGDSVWYRTYDFTEHTKATFVTALIPIADGGFVFAGHGLVNDAGGVMVVKTNAVGDTLWTHLRPGGPYTWSLLERENGDILVYSRCNGLPHLFCLGSDGALRWERFYPEPFESSNGFRPQLVRAHDGGYLATANSRRSLFEHPEWVRLLRLDENGDTLFTRRLDFPYAARVEMFTLVAITDGGYLMSGSWDDTTFQDGASVVVKLNTDLDTLWVRRYQILLNPPLPEPIFENQHAVPLPDGGAVLCSDHEIFGCGWIFLLLRITVAGDTVWTKPLGCDPAWGYSAGPVVRTSDGGYVCAATAGIFESFVTLARLAPDTATVAAPEPPRPLPQRVTLRPCYPNPFNATTTIRYALPRAAHVSLRVYDVLGREMAVLDNQIRERGEYSINIDAQGLPSGIYIARLEAATEIATQKMVLLK